MKQERRNALQTKDDDLSAQLEWLAIDSDPSQPEPKTEMPTNELAFLGSDPQVLELSERDYEALLDAIANPPAPNEAMRRAVARWRDRISHR